MKISEAIDDSIAALPPDGGGPLVRLNAIAPGLLMMLSPEISNVCGHTVRDQTPLTKKALTEALVASVKSAWTKTSGYFLELANGFKKDPSFASLMIAAGVTSTLTEITAFGTNVSSLRVALDHADSSHLNAISSFYYGADAYSSLNTIRALQAEVRYFQSLIDETY